MTATDVLKGPSGTGLSGFAKAATRSSSVAIAVAILAILSGLITYGIVSGYIPNKASQSNVLWLLLGTFGLMLALFVLIALRMVRIWSERRSVQAGARLHARLVGMFGAVAIVPTIFVAVFAVVTLNMGIEQWFSPRVRSAITNSIAVSQRYVNEHEKSITTDALAIANGIQQDPQLFDEQKHVKPEALFAQLGQLTKDRGLQAAYIYDSTGQILGSTKERNFPDTKPPTSADIAQASAGTIVIDANSSIGVVRALIRLQAMNDAYLLVLRRVDPTVFGYYQRSAAAALEYKKLDKNRSKVEVEFAVLYAMLSLLIVMAAILLGLYAANRLVRPISQLIDASERVSAGDLRVQVPVDRDDDEVGILGRAFNRMTSQLQAQRNELVDASHQIDMRRRFTEAVLAGVSAGVVGLDGEGRITIVNRAAARLLHAAPEEIEGKHYSEAVPELATLVRKALTEPVARASGEASIKRGGKTRNLSVQVTSEIGSGEAGYIATFDDITDLVSAQRTAAWADVARRIAHEIKNPLTPIQLSAERLKRKYTNEISTDPEIFQQCVDTIVRQVGDIGRMVDEFSSFARMPAPIVRRENLQELIQQAAFLQRVAAPQIAFETDAPPSIVYAECDGRLVSQALTNVLKNAVESIGARSEPAPPGHIHISLSAEDSRAQLMITDNGIGLPAEHRHRLTEPYVTTRAKGTGLGLAIVRKIFEDHGGELAITDRTDNEKGAEVRIWIPLKQKPVRETENTRASVGA
ncbi:MAG TPA: PAS domain-containing sensor histidine kinase [Rhizomicrobium sp.]|nr:PAS domain-containing sensor histidine kinase [Rhizomicrobium sp.]